jgi:hypothetical protein
MQWATYDVALPESCCCTPQALSAEGFGCISGFERLREQTPVSFGSAGLTLTLKVTFIVTKEHVPVQRLVISTLMLVPAAAAIGLAPVAVAEPPTCTDGQTPGNGNCINGTPPSGGGISGLVPNGAPDVYGPMAPSAR